MVLRRPSRRLIAGRQSNTVFAKPMSGHRCFGSSAGSGAVTVLDFDPVRRMASSGSSRIVNSRGVPMLTAHYHPTSTLHVAPSPRLPRPPQHRPLSLAILDTLSRSSAASAAARYRW